MLKNIGKAALHRNYYTLKFREYLICAALSKNHLMTHINHHSDLFLVNISLCNPSSQFPRHDAVILHK